MEFITKSARETQKFGQKFANNLKNGEIIALTGELGSGKTTFVQGLAKGLGIKERIISPSFLLMRRHKAKRKYLYHVDLYRLEDNLKAEVENLGLKEIWEKPGNIVVIEWAEKIANIIPKNSVWIKFEYVNQEKRRIIISS